MDRYEEPCPVCGTPMECKDYYEPRWLEEAYHSCPDGHYHYEYAYGLTRITVGGQELGATYTNTPEEWKQFQLEVDAAVNQAKQHLAEVR